MATIVIAEGRLRVRLNWLERVGAVRSDIDLPLAAVRDARAVSHPFREIRGIRLPGAGFPGIIALGTWRYPGGADFNAVYSGQRAISIDLISGPFKRLLIGTSDPETLVQTLSATGW